MSTYKQYWAACEETDCDFSGFYGRNNPKAVRESTAHAKPTGHCVMIYNLELEPCRLITPLLEVADDRLF